MHPALLSLLLAVQPPAQPAPDTARLAALLQTVSGNPTLAPPLFKKIPAESLSGRLTSPLGDPLHPATIELRTSDPSYQFVTETTPTGHFRFSNLPPGLYHITFLSLGFHRLTIPGIGLAPNEDKLLPPLALFPGALSIPPYSPVPTSIRPRFGNPPHGILRGSVRPNAAAVRLLGPKGVATRSTTPDPAGDFVFYDLPPGLYTLRIIYPSGPPITRTAYLVQAGYDSEYPPVSR